MLLENPQLAFSLSLTVVTIGLDYVDALVLVGAITLPQPVAIGLFVVSLVLNSYGNVNNIIQFANAMNK